MNELEKIIKSCIEGKRKAQEELYKLFSKKMYGVCLCYSKDYTQAEDVLQEAFVKIFQNIKQFQNKGSFEGWIRKIVVNTALEKFRKQHLLLDEREVYNYHDNFSYDDIISDITAKDLLQLVQELSPQYRMVFCLYAIDGYSHEEIADQLGISEGTSKSNLSRARKILQDKVNTYYGNYKRVASL